MSSLKRPETLTSAVITYIRDAIIRGEFPPGYQLAEQTLAKQMETSRGTVREALLALSESGLVDIYPHRGAFVSQLSARSAWEICNFRALVEPYGARLAIEAHGPNRAVLTAVQEGFDVLRAASAGDDMLAVVDADMAFHARLLSFSGHSVLLEHLKSAQLLTRRWILYTKLYETDLETEVESHAPIVNAVQAGDAGQLEQLVYEHITRAGAQLLERLAELEVDPEAREADRHLATLWPRTASRLTRAG